MKKNKAATSSNSRKQLKTQIKTPLKLKSKKNYEQTVSTLGSRSSMESKIIKKKNLHQYSAEKVTKNSGKEVYKFSSFNLDHKDKRDKSLEIPLLQNSYFSDYNEELISFREYCMLGDKWVPILSETQRNRLTNPTGTQSKKQEQQIIGSVIIDENIQRQIRKKHTPHGQENNKSQNKNCYADTTDRLKQKKNEKQDEMSISNNSKKEKEILQVLQKLREQIENNQNIQNIKQQNKSYYQNVLKNILNRLQGHTDMRKSTQNDGNICQSRIIMKNTNAIAHNNKDENEFNDIVKDHEKLDKADSENKQNVIDQLILQLKQKCAPIQNCNKTQNQGNQYQNEDISPVKIFQTETARQNQNAENQINIQQIIKLRLMRQLGLMPYANPKQTTQQQIKSTHSTISYSQIADSKPEQYNKINTSLGYIMEYLHKIVQTVNDGNFTNQLVKSVKLAWGWPKLQRLSRIRNNKYLGSNSNVIPDFVFQFNEEHYGNDCMFQFIHNKCIFDFINRQFNKLKPFYESNGQTFPWNFKLATPLTFFQIQQNTIGLAFQQIRKKLLQNCSYLCGLMVEQVQASKSQSQILAKIRKQRQDFVFKKQLQKQQYKNREQGEMQNYCTKLLLAVSDQIFSTLLQEFRQLINI